MPRPPIARWRSWGCLIWGAGKRRAQAAIGSALTNIRQQVINLSALEAISHENDVLALNGFWPCCGRLVVALLQRSRDCPLATVQRAQQAVARVSAQPPRFQAERYNPAVLHLRFTSAKGKTTSKQTDSFLDITLISPSGATGRSEGRAFPQPNFVIS